jgi:hypothetical protein
MGNRKNKRLLSIGGFCQTMSELDTHFQEVFLWSYCGPRTRNIHPLLGAIKLVGMFMVACFNLTSLVVTVTGLLLSLFSLFEGQVFLFKLLMCCRMRDFCDLIITTFLNSILLNCKYGGVLNTYDGFRVCEMWYYCNTCL